MSQCLLAEQEARTLSLKTKLNEQNAVAAAESASKAESAEHARSISNSELVVKQLQEEMATAQKQEAPLYAEVSLTGHCCVKSGALSFAYLAHI